MWSWRTACSWWTGTSSSYVQKWIIIICLIVSFTYLLFYHEWSDRPTDWWSVCRSLLPCLHWLGFPLFLYINPPFFDYDECGCPIECRSIWQSPPSYCVVSYSFFSCSLFLYLPCVFKNLLGICHICFVHLIYLSTYICYL